MIAQDRADFSGVIVDPWDHERRGELRRACADKFETVLDTRALELSGQGSLNTPKIVELPWAGPMLPHSPDLLAGGYGQQVAELIAQEVGRQRYSAVLPPAHLIATGDDPWLQVDIQLARWLRGALDRRGLHDVLLYFPLTLRSVVLANPAIRQRLIVALNPAPDRRAMAAGAAVCGDHPGPLGLRRYIEAARDFQRLGLPIVGEKTGTVGIALLAVGAVGGIESGVTVGERFQNNSL